MEWEYNIPKKYQYDSSELLEKFDNDWHIGLCKKTTPVKQLKCKICGSDKFEVGVDDYFTTIRCPICKYEFPIHQG